MKEIQQQFKRTSLNPTATRFVPKKTTELSRAGSSPPKFVSNDLFLMQESDKFLESFGHSFLPQKNYRTPDSTPKTNLRSLPRPKVLLLDY